MQNVISRRYAITAIIIALTAGAHAQGPAPSPLISLPSPPPAKVPTVAAQPSPAPLFTGQDFETFLDALIPSQLQNRDIAGAVVSVVKDGQVLFAKGYGYADFAAKKPVLADQTLFRPGSISKLFTATAVMQLVEQGKLDLDRDVNEYLDFAIPKTYPEPVTLRQLPVTLAQQISQSYLTAAKKLRDFEFVQASPAGALSTTAVDMTRFILAFLQDGAVDGVVILKPETVRQMETRQFELHPMLNGLGVTFMEYSINGQRIIGHGGDTIYFHSDMVIVPQAHVGYFISYNSAGKNVGGGRGEVLRAFANRYFPNPGEPKVDVDPNTAKTDGRVVSGVYEGTRRGETTFLRLLALLGQFSVSSDKDGILTVEGMKNQRGELKKWREIAPLIYSEIDGPDKIAFRRDASGSVREMLPFPAIYEGQRVSWYANKRFINPIVGGNLALALLTVLLWPVAVVVRKRYQRPLFTAKGGRVLYFFSRVICLCEVLFILIPAIVFSRGVENIVIFGDAVDPWLRALYIFGWALMAGLVLLVITAIRFATLPGHGLWFRAHAILLAIGGIAFGLFCWQYHLLETSVKF